MSNHGLSKLKKRSIKKRLWAKSQLCGICGKQLPDMDRSTLDHIIPLSKNGPNDINNLQLAHWKCNNKKGDNE